MRTKVRDVMTTRVVAVKRRGTFKDMAALLTEYRVSAFPVLDDEGKVIGVVSEADMLSKEALVADMGVQAARLGRIAGSPYHDEFAKAAAVTAGRPHDQTAVVVTPDEPVTSAARLMYHGRVKRLPVVGEKGQLIGIVSRADVLSVYSRPDSEIRQEITKNVIRGEFLPIRTSSPSPSRTASSPSRATRKARPGDATWWPKPGTSKGSCRCVTG